MIPMHHGQGQHDAKRKNADGSTFADTRPAKRQRDDQATSCSSPATTSTTSSADEVARRKAAKAKAKSAAKKARRAARAALAARVAADIFGDAYGAAAPPSSSVPTKETSSAASNTTSRFGHNFSADFNDHFETPFQAYADLAPLLRCLNARTKTIYDPFFCKGAMVHHLAKLGFPNVVNRNEDFWQLLRTRTLPAFDIVVTNPPYSDEDKERTVKFVAASGKPGFVLLPSYCANKGWFKRACNFGGAAAGGGGSASGGGGSSILSADRVFVVRPGIDYQYTHIEGKGHKASPFHSSWFCLNMDYEVAQRAMLGFRGDSGRDSGGGPRVCPVKDLKAVGVQFKKRLNPKQRKALRKQQQRQQQGGGL